LHRTQFTESGEILEIEILKQIKHSNLIKYTDSGNIVIDNQKLAYVVLDFVSGETLADKMKRENTLNLYEAKSIILSVLNGLNYLHNKQIIHNDITNQNVMLDLSGKVTIPKIIDFGYARFLKQSNKEFLKDGLNLFYHENGQLKERYTCADGKIVGLYEEWFDNGQLDESKSYVNGNLEGLFQSWHKNGNLMSRWHYNTNENIDGFGQSWHENGQLMEEFTMIDGKHEGLYQLWHENGQLMEKSYYVNGEYDGVFEMWYENGQLEKRCIYENGKIQEYESWDENGVKH
jgi:antitoxin component YwqK of YwqJK toxin-antitoxin module